MHQYTVELRIAGQNLDPDEVTKHLGIEPTQVRRRGERRSENSTWTENMWAYEIIPSQQEAWQSLSDGLMTLLESMRPLYSQIHSYLPANSVYLWCGHFTSSFDGGPALSPTLLRALSDFGVELVLDTYCQAVE